jgi:biopolymer transport protein ExbD
MASFRAKHRRAVVKRQNGIVTLNLVSLTDFFTILLVFLLANSSETEVLTMNSSIKLPESSSHQRPEDRMVISVSSDQIVVNSRRVADVSKMKATETGPIAGLEQELRDEAKRRGEVPADGFDVTVMGDRELPYWLLKRIMMTCQATEFANVSLAVNRVKALEPDATVANANAAAALPPPGDAS